MESFRPWRILAAALALWILAAFSSAQTPTQPPAKPPSLISMQDAARIALAYNQDLRAQRLNVDQSKAGEVTAALKPNPVLNNLVDTIPVFSPQNIRGNTQIYEETLSYTLER